MSDQDEILTGGTVSMPGSAPFPNLIMYPDNARLGFERISASIENTTGDFA